jgi:hypothetical protein
MIGMAPIERLVGSGKPAPRLTGPCVPAIALQVVADTRSNRSGFPPPFAS